MSAWFAVKLLVAWLTTHALGARDCAVGDRLADSASPHSPEALMKRLVGSFACGLLVLSACAQRAASRADDEVVGPPIVEPDALWRVRELHAAATQAAQRGEIEIARARASEAVERWVLDAPASSATAREELLFALGAQAYDWGDPVTSLSAFALLVADQETRLPVDHPDLARARLRLGVARFAAGDLDGAQSSFEQVLATRERTLSSDDSALASVRQNLAAVFGARGDFRSSRALSEQVLATYERTLPAADPRITAAQRNLASAVRELGDLPTARALEERVLATYERTRSADDADLVGARNNLALTLGAMGDFAAARDLQESVLAARDRTVTPDHAEWLTARTNLAGTLVDLGDPSGARRLFEDVVTELEKTRPPDDVELAVARGNLANALCNSGEFAAACTVLLEVVEVQARALPAHHPDLSIARLNLAIALQASGDPSRARPLFESVLESYERTRPDGHPDVCMARAGLVRTVASLLAAMPPGSREAEDATRDLRRLALEYLRGSRIRVRSALLDGSPREVEERLAALDPDLGAALSLALGFGIVDLGPEVLHEAFLLSESCRAGSAISARLSARSAVDEVGAGLRAALAIASAELARLAQSGVDAESLSRSRTEVDRAGRALSRHANDLLGPAEALHPTLETIAGRLGKTEALVAWRRVPLVTVERADPPIWTSVESLVALVVRGSPSGERSTSESTLVLVDLGPCEPIENAAAEWRGHIGSGTFARGLAERPAQRADDPGSGARLRERVLDPLRVALAGVDRLTLVLDDVLHAIPFDALPAGDFGQIATVSSSARDVLLGDRLIVGVRASAIELLVEPRLTVGAPTLLAIGDPDFDLDPSAADVGASVGPIGTTIRTARDAGVLRGSVWENRFGDLPATLEEVRSIARFFQASAGAGSSTQLLERGRATREALSDLAPSARWLHVATHGWFAPESIRSTADPVLGDRGRGALPLTGESPSARGMVPMLLCGLAFAGSNRPMDTIGRIPGLVTAQEIAALDLSNCELAVLSACDTNVGLRRTGQGVASLQRALHMAGARSVITSLWQVPDEATKELMIEFYRGVWIDRLPKHRALWEAKRRLREARDEAGNPRYALRDWAAWILSGDPD